MANKTDYKVATVNNVSQTLLSIAASSTLSPMFDCGGCSPTGLIFPSGATSSNITIYASKYGTSGTFYAVTNFDGSALLIPIVASKWVPLLPAIFNSIPYFQISFGTTQTSAYDVDVVLGPIYQGLHG